MATRKAGRKADKTGKAPRRGIGRTAAISLGAAAVAACGTLIALLARGRAVAPGEHAAPDLAPDRPHPGPEDRAPDAFRPDPAAPVPAAEREDLRPATIPVD